MRNVDASLAHDVGMFNVLISSYFHFRAELRAELRAYCELYSSVVYTGNTQVPVFEVANMVHVRTCTW